MSTQSLAWILGLALVAALLAITGWLTMLACVILTLVQYQIVGWEWALAIAGGGAVRHAIRNTHRALTLPGSGQQRSDTGGEQYQGAGFGDCSHTHRAR
jgi:succinate dehydrogenase/fumarate reductase cytochrome b subunit